MSAAGGTDNPAFAVEDECASGANKLENGGGGGGGGQQVNPDQDRKSTAEGAPTENGHQRSYVSQHYVEPVKSSAEPCYKTETRIELPGDNTEKSAPEPKLNGVHGNGNNNDASFLNNSAASVQVNESGKKEQIEAVNLELVSMRPYTGTNIQTKGQEACEVPSDPYEEYFVPVNEHRKYIRGEKLYVTKDKRSRNSYWRRMAWGCGLLVLLIAVIIAILAATGVILTQEATEPLENVAEGDQLSDVQTAGRQEYVKNPPSSPPPLTSSFPPWPTTDETPYRTVPDVLDGILRLDDFNWSEDLNDTKSRVYRQVTAELEKHLSDMLRSTDGAPVIKVYDINKEGEMKFRINYQQSSVPQGTQESIEKVLRKNGNMIGRYHLSRLQVGKLVDQCEHGDFECAEGCRYDYFDDTFVCICNPGKTLHEDGKTCVDDSDLSNVEMEDVIPEFSTESTYDFVQGRSRDPSTALEFGPRHPNTWEDPNFKTGPTETDASTSGPATERVRPQSDRGSSMESTPTTKHVLENEDDFHWNQEHFHHSTETSSEPPVKVSSTAEPTMRFTVPTVEPEPTAEPEPSAEPELVPEPTAEPESVAEPEPTAEPKRTIELESVGESDQPTAEPEASAEPAPTAEPRPAIESKPIAEVEPAVKSETASEVVSTFETVSVTEIPNSTAKSTMLDDDDTSAESTRTSLPNHPSTTNVPESFTRSIENNSSEDDESPTTVMPDTTGDAVSLQVIPLTSKNESVDTNDYVETETESTTVQPYLSKDDENGESTITETDFTTLDYRNLKQDDNEDVTSIEFEKNQEKSNTNAEQFTKNAENKETDSTMVTSLGTNVNNVQSENSPTGEYDLTTEQRSSTTSRIFELPTSTAATVTPNAKDRTEPAIGTTTLDDKHFHTIEINGVSDASSETYGNSKVYDTTVIPETTSTDVSARSGPTTQHEERTAPAGTDAQDPNEKNVIERMPTTIFPKVPKDFAHNVEPLVEPIARSPDDEHIMLIPKSSEEPEVEIHAIIPQLIPERSTQTANESARAENSTTGVNDDGADAVNGGDSGARKSSTADASSIHESSTVRGSDENVVHTGDNKYTVRPEDAQEHSTSHPLHPAIFPENSVDHLAGGKADVSDDRHVEDMSPFLPDVHREKESAKKAPRLDKDEQDVPNPFETHVEDVVTLVRVNASTGTEGRRTNETETKDLLNDVNSHSPASDEGRSDVTKEIRTESRKTNDGSGSAEDAIKNDLDVSEVAIGDAGSKSDSRQGDSSAKSDGSGERFPQLRNASAVTENGAGAGERENDETSKVLPLAVEDRPVDAISQTTVQFADLKTSDEPAEVIATVAVEKKKAKEEEEEEEVLPRTAAVESGTTRSEKPEENAVEDQYNDITDETLSKGYRRDNAHGKDISLKVAEQSKKAILSHVDAIEENSPYGDVSSSTKVKDGTGGEETPPPDAAAHTNPAITMELTTQEPVLPMEIQQEMSTTVATDEKVEIITAATVTEDGKPEENNTESSNVDRSSEREAVTTAQIVTTQSTLEMKTTAQVPILPEELQTTESDVLTTTTTTTTTTMTTTSSMRPSEEKEMEANTDRSEAEVSAEEVGDGKTMMNEKQDAVTHSTGVDADANGASSESSVTATTVYESNVSVESDSRTGQDEDRSDRTTTESAKMETTSTMSAERGVVTDGMERTTSATPSDVTTTEDVRPVTEMLDDTQPMIEFDYRTLFATTTPRSAPIQPSSDELSEEQLRVIPLEKSQEGKKKSADKKGFDKYKYKKEKDLSLEDQDGENVLARSPDPIARSRASESPRTTEGYEELSDSAVSPDLDPSVPRFTLADTKGNILPISKLRRTETADGGDGKGTIAETRHKSYPSFIPVSEEIIESAPVTEPYVIVRSGNYRSAIASTSAGVTADHEERSAIASTSADLAKVNETTVAQPVAPAADLSFGDALAERATVDRVTKEPHAVVRPTVPLIPSAGAESASVAAPEDVVFSRCTAGQFQCANGTSRNGAYCVALSAKCDSESDCSDGSDELNCEEEGCPGNFRCASGRCLRRHLVCNKIADCEDGSDERDCEDWKCQFDEFRCPSGRCIPALWHCDGRPDCEDHLDEHNCAEGCENNEYLCPTEKWCIPQTWRCDGTAECADGADEKLCDCALDQFKCRTGGGCVPSTQVCDGVENCPDRSDEWGCLIANVTAGGNLTDADLDAGSNEASEPTDGASLLKIKQYDGDYRLVCWDGWNEKFSDVYCRSLGFAKAETTESFAWDERRKILRLKANPNHRGPLVTNLEEVKFCVSGKVVQVSCQEFSCGLRYDAEGPTARSAGGISASDGQRSSVALLKGLKHAAACTASILGPVHALASYSCIHRYKEGSEWQLLAGGNTLRGRAVKNIVPYPQAKYNQFLYNNDIALVELEEPLVLSRNISAVCLPRQSIQPRQICVTAGWGFSTNGEIDLRQYLKFLPVPTYDSDKCNATSHYAGFITEHDICVGFTDTDKGPCYNDEGAPLMCASESQSGSERWEIQGLLSHHSRCSRGHPAIYSSLEPALSWLRESVPALRTQG